MAGGGKAGLVREIFNHCGVPEPWAEVKEHHGQHIGTDLQGF